MTVHRRVASFEVRLLLSARGIPRSQVRKRLVGGENEWMVTVTPTHGARARRTRSTGPSSPADSGRLAGAHLFPFGRWATNKAKEARQCGMCGIGGGG